MLMKKKKAIECTSKLLSRLVLCELKSQHIINRSEKKLQYVFFSENYPYHARRFI